MPAARPSTSATSSAPLTARTSEPLAPITKVALRFDGETVNVVDVTTLREPRALTALLPDRLPGVSEWASVSARGEQGRQLSLHQYKRLHRTKELRLYRDDAGRPTLGLFAPGAAADAEPARFMPNVGAVSVRTKSSPRRDVEPGRLSVSFEGGADAMDLDELRALPHASAVDRDLRGRLAEFESWRLADVLKKVGAPKGALILRNGKGEELTLSAEQVAGVGYYVHVRINHRKQLTLEVWPHRADREETRFRDLRVIRVGS